MADKNIPPPPAYFLSLSLENVRSFGAKQTISFATKEGRPAQWTIILGDNGVGKTTVLKSLAAVILAPHPLADERQKKDVSSWTAALLRLSNPFKLVWSPFRMGASQFASFSVNAVEGDKLTAATWGENISKRAYSIYKEEKVMTSTSGGPPIGLTCYGYGAGRTTGNSTLSETPETADTCASLFDDRADLLNPEEWFLQMEYSSLKQDQQAAKALEQVRQVLLKVLPDVTDLRISSKGHQQYLELETPYGWVRLRDMSLGYQTLVVWLTDFASKLFLRYPDSPNPVEEPAIVLIDEIDLHLHPSWQRKLLGFLSGIFKNTQFIATAHSPLVVQAAGDVDANIILLRREGDQTIVVTDVEDVRGWRLDQILTSELFGLDTARSVATERKLARRTQLLTKAKRTAAEKQELDALTTELDAKPVGETPSEREVSAVLQELRQRLLKKDANPSAA